MVAFIEGELCLKYVWHQNGPEAMIHQTALLSFFRKKLPTWLGITAFTSVSVG
jgi:hypothetical protein